MTARTGSDGSRRGMVVVISAPSGAGKGALRRALLARDRGIRFCPSVTTRACRPGERDGEDYQFVTASDFDALVARGELIEWALVFGCSYGTPRLAIEHLTAAGLDVLLEKDVQGAVALRRVYPDGVFVFVVPPSLAELARRIRSRGTESGSDMELRLARVESELRHVEHYDYIVINDVLDDAVDELAAIIRAERCRVSRRGGLVQKLLEIGEVGSGR